MFETYFQEYLYNQKSEFFRAANEAANALEATIRKRYTSEEYVDLFEDAITKYGYEMERVAVLRIFANQKELKNYG